MFHPIISQRSDLTGLSDHHKLTTILRKTISKGNLKKIYKRFDQKKFETELLVKPNSQTNLN